jgi:hypothetical protein
VPIVLKSASLKLLEPSGPVQACNGIALRGTRKFGELCCNQRWKTEHVSCLRLSSPVFVFFYLFILSFVCL